MLPRKLVPRQSVGGHRAQHQDARDGAAGDQERIAEIGEEARLGEHGDEVLDVGEVRQGERLAEDLRRALEAEHHHHEDGEDHDEAVRDSRI